MPRPALLSTVWTVSVWTNKIDVRCSAAAAMQLTMLTETVRAGRGRACMLKIGSKKFAPLSDPSRYENLEARLIYCTLTFHNHSLLHSKLLHALCSTASPEAKAVGFCFLVVRTQLVIFAVVLLLLLNQTRTSTSVSGHVY